MEDNELISSYPVSYASLQQLSLVKVIINDKIAINALDDSGSHVSIISKRHVDISKATRKVQRLAVMGNFVDIQYIIPRLKITLGKTSSFIYNVCVIDDNRFSLILGQNWRQNCGLRICQTGRVNEYYDLQSNDLIYSFESEPISDKNSDANFNDYCGFTAIQDEVVTEKLDKQTLPLLPSNNDCLDLPIQSLQTEIIASKPAIKLNHAMPSISNAFRSLQRRKSRIKYGYKPVKSTSDHRLNESSLYNSSEIHRCYNQPSVKSSKIISTASIDGKYS